jgi:hypothetical protein
VVYRPGNGDNCLLGKENTILEKRFSIRDREQPLCENKKRYVKREKPNGEDYFPIGKETNQKEAERKAI